MIQEYVCGFAFNETLTQVALIQKKRPSWQAGRLNGIGGKFEPGETGYEAMVREFKEETGVTTVPQDWKPFCSYSGDEIRDHARTGNQFVVHFFCCTGPHIHLIRSVTDEPVVVIDTTDTRYHSMLPNLQWLIPLAIQMLKWPEEKIVVHGPMAKL